MRLQIIWKNAEHYLHLNQFFQEKRDFFIEGLQQTKFEILPCEGTYFLSANYAKLSDLNDVDFATKLTKEYKVATIPFSAFYQDKTDHNIIRFCFAKKNETLDEALEKLTNL